MSDPQTARLAADHLAGNPRALASLILAGDLPASTAMHRPEVYPHLNASPATGVALPFLGTSSKIEAGQRAGILSKVLYMLPAMSSGREACAGRSEGCTAACLVRDTGRMNMAAPVRARIRRHASFYADRTRFLADVHAEVRQHAKRALREGKIPAVRLNGTTDLPWHRMPFETHDGERFACLHDASPDVNFYEYTKHPLARSIGTRGSLPSNLHLVFSVSEREDADERAAEYLAAGYSVAVVLATAKHDLPGRYTIGGVSAPVVDGDAHDARFLDPRGSIVGLAAKGRAKHDTSGFVRAV